MDARSIVLKAVGPALCTDRRHRITAINPEARDLLGLGTEPLRRRPLHDLIEARDIFGNLLRIDQIPFIEMVTRGEPVNSLEICARQRDSGKRLRLSVSVVVVLGSEPGNHELVYLLRPILRRRKADEAIERILASPAGASLVPNTLAPVPPDGATDLTRRQTEILRLLARGQSSKEIAAALGIRLSTVRTHLRDLQKRLGARSRVEAISRAYRERLI